VTEDERRAEMRGEKYIKKRISRVKAENGQLMLIVYF
jgi:hypothetical protein